jgi:hypothetical protein
VDDQGNVNGEFVERVHRPRLAPETCTATPIPVALPHITWLRRRRSIARFRTSVRRLPTRPPVEHIRPRWKATQRWRGSMVLRVCHCRRDPVIDHLCPSPMSCICCIFFCLLGLRSPNVYTLTIGCVLHSAQACSRRPLSSGAVWQRGNVAAGSTEWRDGRILPGQADKRNRNPRVLLTLCRGPLGLLRNCFAGGVPGSLVPKRLNQGEAHRKCPCVLFPGRNINQGSCPVVTSTTAAWQTQVDS